MTGDLQHYIALMLDFVREAGAYALERQSRITRTLKADQSIVTETDLAISQMFADRLAALPDAADHFLIDEEFIGPVSQVRDRIEKSKYVWVLDPIDGTMPYASQMPFWGIFLCLFMDGTPHLSCIYLPALQELLYYDGSSCFFSKANEPPQPMPLLSAQPLTKTSIIFASWRNKPDYQRLSIFQVGCAAVFAAFTLLGRSRAAYFGPSMKLWDVVAVIALVPQVGLELRNMRTGQRVDRFDLDLCNENWALQDQLLLCHPDDYGQLCTAQAPLN